MDDRTQMMTLWHALEREIMKFHAWADAHSEDFRRQSVWEGYYASGTHYMRPSQRL